MFPSPQFRSAQKNSLLSFGSGIRFVTENCLMRAKMLSWLALKEAISHIDFGIGQRVAQ